MQLLKKYCVFLLILLGCNFSYGSVDGSRESAFDKMKVLILEYEKFLDAPYLVDDVDSMEGFERVECVERELEAGEGVESVRSDLVSIESLSSAMNELFYDDSPSIRNVESCNLSSIWQIASFHYLTQKKLVGCIDNSCGEYEDFLLMLSSNADRGKKKISECRAL
jgi:hypothetical protein